MLTLDPSIDVESLHRLVAAEWGPCAPPDFAPVGGDSWCFVADPWWVSVRRDRGGHCPGAYELAAQLRARGLDFVLAPERNRSGTVVGSQGAHPVVVFRQLAGAELDHADATTAQAHTVVEMVSTLHATAATDEIGLPRESFELSFADELETGVARALDGAGAAGPYGAAVSELVGSNRARLAEVAAEMTQVRQYCVADPGALVLTHGEPTNVFVRPDGQLLLMDWGSAAWAPSERDWLALARLGIPWPTETRPHLRRYYELWWVLSEIAEYVDRFTRPHVGDVGDDDKWAELLLYLPQD